MSKASYTYEVHGRSITAEVTPVGTVRDSWGRETAPGKCQAENPLGRVTWTHCGHDATTEVVELDGSPKVARTRHYCNRHLAAARRRTRYNVVIRETPLAAMPTAEELDGEATAPVSRLVPGPNAAAINDGAKKMLRGELILTADGKRYGEPLLDEVEGRALIRAAEGQEAKVAAIKRVQAAQRTRALAAELRVRAELLELTPILPHDEREPLEALERVVSSYGENRPGGTMGRKRRERIARRMQETGLGLWHTSFELEGNDGRGCECRACADGRTDAMLERARVAGDRRGAQRAYEELMNR